MRTTRFVTEAPYWEPETLPFESRARLCNRLKEHAPEFYTAMQTWRSLRQKDLIEIDGMDPKAAEKRAWTEVSLLYPPPGIQAQRPVARLVAVPDPIKPKEEVERHKRQVQRLDRLVKGIEQIHPAKAPPAPAKEPKPAVTMLDDALFENADWASVPDPERFVSEVMWVYANLQRKCQPADAPGAGAWTLLTYARDNQDKFFTNIYPKALDFQSKLEAGRQAHAERMRKLEIEAELERHRANQMTDEEADDLAETLDLLQELGVPYAEVAAGIRMTREPPPALQARLAKVLA